MRHHQAHDILDRLVVLANWLDLITLKVELLDCIVCAGQKHGQIVDLPAHAKDGAAHILLPLLLHLSWHRGTIHVFLMVDLEDQNGPIPAGGREHSKPGR